MSLPEWYFNEVGGFTAVLVVLVGVLYFISFTMFLRESIRHWRKRR